MRGRGRGTYPAGAPVGHRRGARGRAGHRGDRADRVGRAGAGGGRRQRGHADPGAAGGADARPRWLPSRPSLPCPPPRSRSATPSARPAGSARSLTRPSRSPIRRCRCALPDLAPAARPAAPRRETGARRPRCTSGSGAPACATARRPGRAAPASTWTWRPAAGWRSSVRAVRAVTAAAVLLRFCELYGGSATLNGQDLSAYAADDVRTLISGCAQDPHIFAASLTANLRVARPEATDAELADAARQARLLDWIETLRAGLGHSGRPARQRAVRRPAPAASRSPGRCWPTPPCWCWMSRSPHLDAGTRRAVTADLLSATRGRTTLLITHDLAGLEQVDEIVVLDCGAVTERGPHAQLLAAGRLVRRALARAGAGAVRRRFARFAGRTSPRPRTRCSRARSGQRRRPRSPRSRCRTPSLWPR